MAERIVLISGATGQQGGAGVQHYVYASVASADRKTGVPHFDNKSRVEDTIRGLGFPSYAIVR